MRPVGPETTAPDSCPAAAAADPDGALVRLSPEERAGLIAAVEARPGMPEEAKARILAALEADEVPQSMIDRLSRSGG